MKRITKKDLALSLHAAGRSVEEIARALESHPSYIANVLAASGRAPDYSDLYVSSGAQNGYARMFQGALRFRDMESARESVDRIDEMYRRFELDRDRRGQHQAQILALIGKNRAEGIGKYAEAQLFADWLIENLRAPVSEAAALRAGDGEQIERELHDGVLALAV